MHGNVLEKRDTDARCDKGHGNKEAKAATAMATALPYQFSISNTPTLSSVSYNTDREGGGGRK